jgi:hypothetical protein
MLNFTKAVEEGYARLRGSEEVAKLRGASILEQLAACDRVVKEVLREDGMEPSSVAVARVSEEVYRYLRVCPDCDAQLEFGEYHSCS